MYPNFVVIGGMKCGSTTLFHDLGAHPKISLAEKECNILSSGLSIAEARRRYESSYSRAAHDAVRGDVSTTYAMLPDEPGVAAMAEEVAGGRLRIVYLVREPVSRAISHHHHMHTMAGPHQMGPDINECIHERPELISYSLYANQLRPWREAFGDDSILVVPFEQFVANRFAMLCRIFDFVGAPPIPATTAPTKAFNTSAGKPVLNRFWHVVHRSHLYQKVVRPMAPPACRQLASRWLLPKAPASLALPTTETVEQIIGACEPEERELRTLVGQQTPLWNWGEIRGRFADAPLSAAG